VLPQSSADQVTEALRLHAHVEKLNLVVFATAAKSVDIVQARIVCFLMLPSLCLVLTAKAFVSMEHVTQDSPRRTTVDACLDDSENGR
jgi:hypothetical protein